MYHDISLNNGLKIFENPQARIKRKNQTISAYVKKTNIIIASAESVKITAVSAIMLLLC